MSSQQFRVVIIEDDDFVLAKTISVLQAIPELKITSVYQRYETMLGNQLVDRPDIVVMDLGLSGATGIKWITKIKQARPNTIVIVTTVHETPNYIFGALGAGAMGYILKSDEAYFDILARAIKNVTSECVLLSNSVMLTLVKSFQKNPKTPLSIRETEVLSLFAKGQSCTGIAETLCISRHTVRTHIRNIYEKLDVNKKAKAIEIAFAEKFI